MENNKQTAVDWLDRWFRDNPEATHEEGNKALHHAKEMEKQQTINDYSAGVNHTIKGYENINCYKYWNETYGGNNEQQ